MNDSMEIRVNAGQRTATGSAIDEFTARVLDDPAAQARLAMPFATEGYAAVAIAVAAEYGMALTPGEIDERLRPDPLGLGRLGAAPVTLDRWPGVGWVPTRSVPTGGAPAFDWAWFGEAPLREPFFEDSVRRASALPFNRMFRTRTTLASLVADYAGQSVTPPSGFIFHMSRCGSTLAARMLMAVPGHAVASEPEPLDAVLQWAILSGASHDDQVAALRAVVAALGRDRIPGQRHFFIKLAAWHVLALPLFRTAFPDVPWLFLYRDPVEVMVSQTALPGFQLVPGGLPPALIGIDVEGATSLVDYGARVLARICGAPVEHWLLGGGMLVRFDDLYEAMTTTVPAHFGFAAQAGQRAAMMAATAANAKRPSALFMPDGMNKQDMASPDVVAAATTYVAPHIVSLDILCQDSVRSRDYS